MKKLRIILFIAFVSTTLGCRESSSGTTKLRHHLSQDQAVSIAVNAFETQMSSAYIGQYKPYHAEFKDGAWHVFGTIAGPGGTPEALIQDGDGKVLFAGHGQ